LISIKAEQLTSLFTAIIAITTVIYTCVTYRQLGLTRDSIDQSKRALEISQKAYVYVAGIESYPEDPTRTRVKIILKNSGRLPSAGFAIEIDGGNGIPPKVTPVHRVTGGEETNIPSDAPGYAVTFSMPPFTDEELKVLKAGHSPATLFGTAYYGNGFGVIDTSPFCFVYFSNPSVGWVPCPIASVDDMKSSISKGEDTSALIDRYKQQQKRIANLPR
jgi:hypothetical protein